jgi:hypothetical protein
MTELGSSRRLVDQHYLGRLHMHFEASRLDGQLRFGRIRDLERARKFEPRTNHIVEEAAGKLPDRTYYKEPLVWVHD